MAGILANGAPSLSVNAGTNTGYGPNTGPRGVGLEFLKRESEEEKFRRSYRTRGGDPLTAPSGTGAAMLGSLNWGAPYGVTQEQLAANPFGGSSKQNYSPAFLAQWLKGEMGPGGFLGAASQTRSTALGMGQIIGGGEADVNAAMRSYAASGVAAPAMAAMRGANRSIMADRARSYLTQRRAEQDSMRFDAMKGFVDTVMQTVAAAKGQQINLEAAKEGASATRSAGKTAAAGAMLGMIGAALI